MHIVRKSSLTPVPWKNGGGVTHEVWREPAGGDTFDWRVSIAQIEVDGPFSHFPGVLRTMVLLRGAGVTLAFSEGPDKTLRAPGDLVVFDGAMSTHCSLLGGSCTDLNLMVARSTGESRAWVAVLDEPLSTAGFASGTTLICPLAGEATLDRDSSHGEKLGEWDLAVVSRREACTVAPAANAGGQSLVFFATLP